MKYFLKKSAISGGVRFLFSSSILADAPKSCPDFTGEELKEMVSKKVGIKKKHPNEWKFYPDVKINSSSRGYKNYLHGRTPKIITADSESVKKHLSPKKTYKAWYDIGDIKSRQVMTVDTGLFSTRFFCIYNHSNIA